MVTVEALKQFGANTEEGIARCVNMEPLYLKLVKNASSDAGFAKLEEAINAGDLDAAFDAAHGLKGILANLALTPILDPVSEVTEHLRIRKDMDYSGYITQIKAKRDELAALCE